MRRRIRAKWEAGEESEGVLRKKKAWLWRGENERRWEGEETTEEASRISMRKKISVLRRTTGKAEWVIIDVKIRAREKEED